MEEADMKVIDLAAIIRLMCSGCVARIAGRHLHG